MTSTTLVTGRDAGHRSRLGRWSRARAVGTALLLCLPTACSGGDDPPGHGRHIDVRSEQEATAALLTAADLGRGYVVTGTSGDDVSSSLGCLDALHDLEDTGSVTVVQRTFERDVDAGLPVIGNEVASYARVAPIDGVLEQFRSTAEECTPVG